MWHFKPLGRSLVPKQHSDGRACHQTQITSRVLRGDTEDDFYMMEATPDFSPFFLSYKKFVVFFPLRLEVGFSDRDLASHVQKPDFNPHHSSLKKKKKKTFPTSPCKLITCNCAHMLGLSGRGRGMDKERRGTYKRTTKAVWVYREQQKRDQSKKEGQDVGQEHRRPVLLEVPSPGYITGLSDSALVHQTHTTAFVFFTSKIHSHTPPSCLYRQSWAQSFLEFCFIYPASQTAMSVVPRITSCFSQS